jgi:hypothetical protein
MRKAFFLVISMLSLASASAVPARAADLGIPVPAGAVASCSGLALVCQNGRTYPICPIAVSVAGELVTGRLVTAPHRGTHIRLIPMGDGYRYAGRGIWFDGKYAAATLFFGQQASTACEVVTTDRTVVAAKF